MKNSGRTLIAIFLTLFTVLTAFVMVSSQFEFGLKRYYGEEVLPRLETKITSCETFDEKLVFIGENEMLVMDKEGNLEEITLSFTIKAITEFKGKYYLISENDKCIKISDSFLDFSQLELKEFEYKPVFFMQTEETLFVVTNGESSLVIYATADGENWTAHSLGIKVHEISCGVIKDDKLIIGGGDGLNYGVLIVVNDLLSISKNLMMKLEEYSTVRAMTNINGRVFIGCSDGKIGYLDDLSEVKSCKINNKILVRQIVSYHEKIFVIVSPYANHETDSASSIIYMSEDEGETFVQKFDEEIRFFACKEYNDKLYVAGEYGEIYTLYSMKTGGLFG